MAEQQTNPVAGPDEKLFRSKRDARSFLAAQLVVTYGMGIVFVTTPLFSTAGWIVGMAPMWWAILSLGERERKLLRRLGVRGWLASPFSAPVVEARRRLWGREGWEEAFEWLGRDRLSGATARWTATWFVIACWGVMAIWSWTDGA